MKLGLTKPEDREHAYIQCVDPPSPTRIAVLFLRNSFEYVTRIEKPSFSTL